MLADRAARAGYRLLTVESVGSTNEEALDRARAGETGGLWIRAEVQTNGRGRLGRHWTSPPGNLYVTLLLVDPAPVRHIPALGFVAGVALARAVAQATGAASGLAIKWPNDLLWQGAKLAGILLEGTQTPQGRFAVAIGMGVNCLSHPPGLLYPTTCLADFASCVPSPAQLLTLLSETMVDALDLWDRGAHFAAIRREWLALALPSGSALTVQLPDGVRRGRFQTIDGLGRLMIETDSGPLTVEAADVFLTAQGDPGAVQSR